MAGFLKRPPSKNFFSFQNNPETLHGVGMGKGVITDYTCFQSGGSFIFCESAGEWPTLGLAPKSQCSASLSEN